MKKILTGLLTTALLVSVNGCKTVPPDSEPAQQTLMVKAESAPVTDQTAINIAATLEQIIAGINFKPVVSIFKKTVTKNESDKQNHATNTKQESSQAPIFGIENPYMQGAEPIEQSKVVGPTPIPEPVIEEPSFDIGYWIGYAQSYAQGLGLRLESSAVDCWDNPIGAGPHSTCLDRDIASRLSRYANDPDITDVWIWYEPTDGNCYDIYIGYA